MLREFYGQAHQTLGLRWTRQQEPRYDDSRKGAPFIT